MAEAVDTTKTVVKTYVPSFQKEEWADHAAELDMSLSEYLRCMVQAGRKGFDITRLEDQSSNATPGGEGLEEPILKALHREPLTWNELLDEVVTDIETTLEETLQELADQDIVEHRLQGEFILKEDRGDGE